MNFTKIVLVALAGFLLGVGIFHLRTVKAQTGTVVRMQIMELNEPVHVVGSEIVGFSCVSIPGARGIPSIQCFIASR